MIFASNPSLIGRFPKEGKIVHQGINDKDDSVKEICCSRVEAVPDALKRFNERMGHLYRIIGINTTSKKGGRVIVLLVPV